MVSMGAGHRPLFGKLAIEGGGSNREQLPSTDDLIDLRVNKPSSSPKVLPDSRSGNAPEKSQNSQNVIEEEQSESQKKANSNHKSLSFSVERLLKSAQNRQQSGISQIYKKKHQIVTTRPDKVA